MGGKVITLDGLNRSKKTKKAKCTWQGKPERPWAGRVDLFGSCGDVGLDLVKDKSANRGEFYVDLHYDSKGNKYTRTKRLPLGTKDLKKAKTRACKIAKSKQ